MGDYSVLPWLLVLPPNRIVVTCVEQTKDLDQVGTF
jgi:hypothetical protein